MLVGLSGGLDSTVLLTLLAGMPAMRTHGLRAIHVHHGLHPQADAWATHCQRQCDALGVPLVVVRVAVDAASGRGPEDAARIARHAAFAAHLQPGEVRALAHHRQDQAETFLLRALRGAGPEGLAAMRPLRSYGTGWLWRPLLDAGRDALLAYARLHGLAWIDDPSNDDLRLDRNFLRHQVLPLLRTRWPGADAALAHDAALQADAVELLDAQDARALASARTADPHALSATAIAAMPVAQRARVLRRWIASLGLPPLPAQGIASIESDLLHARSDARATFAWAGARVQRWRDVLHAAAERPALPAGYDYTWDGHEPLQLPTGDRLALLRQDGSGFDAPVRVHARAGGERIVLPGRTHSHALKHVLQELGVPPWERTRLPLLSDGDARVLAAGDLVLSAPLDAWLRRHRARLTWARPHAA